MKEEEDMLNQKEKSIRYFSNIDISLSQIHDVAYGGVILKEVA